jgi:hypothetical protein
MSKQIALTHLDCTDTVGTNQVNIISADPEVPGSYKETTVDFSSFSAAEQTQINDCLAMVESKLPA